MASLTAKISYLDQWFRANRGYLHPSLFIAHTPISGLHWRAKSSIDPGTTLITVPHTLSLSYLTALVDDVFPVFKTQRHRFKVESIGFFYLMAQYVNRETSFWKPYLDLLPSPDSQLATPLRFSEQENIDWLEGTDVLHTARGRLEVYEQYYASGIDVLKQAGIDVAPYTWSLFLWSVTMFTSRSFSSKAIRPQDSKYWTAYKSSPDSTRRQAVLLDMSHTLAEDLDFSVLFPVLDAGNHDLATKVDWTLDPGRFTVTSLETYAEGAEVYNNYGAWKSNSELLLGYGFCIHGNPNDTVMLTLKPPPPNLQTRLRTVHPGYFHLDGTWASEKATFHVQAAASSTSNLATDGHQIFTTLPEPLLELLLYMLHHERNLPFTFIQNPHTYLSSPSSRYTPFLARALVQSLAPKLAALTSISLLSAPKNSKQAQAKIYRDAQIRILESNIAALKAYTRSLLKPASASGPRVVTLEGLLEYFTFRCVDSSIVDEILQGIAASAGTAELPLLKQAGWEEDVFVLLLCFMLLHNSSSGERKDAEWVPEGLDLTSLLSPSRFSEQQENEGGAGDLLPIVHTAAAATAGGGGVWADARWSGELIAKVGGRMLGTEGFLMMEPVGGAGGRGEARMVVYLHSSSG